MLALHRAEPFHFAPQQPYDPNNNSAKGPKALALPCAFESLWGKQTKGTGNLPPAGTSV